ncbi:hypothetical protein AB8U03_15795 [Clostridium sp. Mt-5]|uniref:Uncharacterized protein n=1 Tax=Clostridium moutaii TaxID=3240932 RepID=A0ABV4BXQ6_9CLOT
MKVDVSFKQTTRDIKLYTAVMSQEEKSEFVKKALEFYIKHLEKEKENGSICIR